MPFFGREHELQQLRKFYHSEKENLAIVYGRRRVGKSELLRASLCGDGLPFAFLQCRATSLKSNANDLMAQAGNGFGLPDLKLDDIESALKFIYSFMKDCQATRELTPYVTQN